jgi:hypothetical protein
MSAHLLGFVDSSKAWQAELIKAIRHNNWQPHRASDVDLFSLQFSNGVHSDKKNMDQKRIHHLLRFDEIEDRHETIAEAHKRTFE